MDYIEILGWVGRIVLGLFFVMSGAMHFMKKEDMVGYAKMRGLPAPMASVLLSGLVLLLGGIGILGWWYVELSLIALAIFLLLAAVLMHGFWKEKEEKEKQTQMHFFMANMALMGALLMLLPLA